MLSLLSKCKLSKIAQPGIILRNTRTKEEKFEGIQLPCNKTRLVVYLDVQIYLNVITETVNIITEIIVE